MTSSACMRMSMSAAFGLCCSTAAAAVVASACSAGMCPAHAACSSSNTGLQHGKQAFLLGWAAKLQVRCAAGSQAWHRQMNDVAMLAAKPLRH